MTAAPRASPSQRRGVRVVVAVAVVAAVIVGVLATLPVEHSFAGSFSLPRLHLGSYVLQTPEGATVTGTWSEAGGGSVDFMIVDGTDYPIYHSQGTGGSFSFPATSPPYGFVGVTSANVTDTVSISGSYSSPLV